MNWHVPKAAQGCLSGDTVGLGWGRPEGDVGAREKGTASGTSPIFWQQ